MTADTLLMGLRWYLIVKAMESGCTFKEAADSVDEVMSTITKPDPILRTYAQWEELHGKK